MKTKKTSVREMCYIGIFVAIIAVCAQVSIPMPYGVPLTLQTLAVPLAGIVLGMKSGTLATLIYILIGAIGVPVFTGFMGGIGIIFGRTGGFIITFPLMALTAGIGAKHNNFWLTLCLTAGAAINFIGGMLMYSIVTSNSLIVSYHFVVMPFIPTAIIKIVIAVALGRLVKQALAKNGLLLT